MNNDGHKGLDLAGIIITYVVASAYILLIIISWISWGWLLTFEAIILLLSLGSLTLTILYHTNKIRNYILIGIFAILISIIGGIFILVDGSNTPKIKEDLNESNPLNLEKKLKELDLLFIKGVLSKEEYIAKRNSIIEKY